MGYTKLGYRTIPEAYYIPAYATELLKKENMEAAIATALEKLGRGNRKLTSIIFDDLLQIDTPDFKASGEPRKQFLHIMIKTLNHMGFLTEAVPIIELRTSPILDIDEAVSQMLGARMRWFTKEDVGGEYATLDNLRSLLPSAIRSYSFVHSERAVMVSRLRTYIGHIGYKVMRGAEISQQEKTLLVLYGNPRIGSSGYSEFEKAQVQIAAKETADPLAMEAFELYKQYTEPGSFFRFVRLKSDANHERLTLFVRQLPTEVSFWTGFMQPYGPFKVPVMEQVESMKWSTNDQMVGLTDGSDYFVRQTQSGSLLTVKPPRLAGGDDEGNLATFVLDTPDIIYMLDDEKDVSKTTWQYFSKWRKRYLNSIASNIGTGDYLADFGLERTDHGDTTIENITAATLGLADYSHPTLVNTFREMGTERLWETIFLPEAASRKLVDQKVDMSDFYTQRGLITTMTAFAEKVFPARVWYGVPDKAALSFIAERMGLTYDEQTRYERIITIAHNAAKLERLTGRKPVFDVKEYCAHVGGYTV